jgi:hypothetical protein
VNLLDAETGMTFEALFALAYDRRAAFLRYQLEGGISEIAANDHLYIVEVGSDEKQPAVETELPGQPSSSAARLARLPEWELHLHWVASNRRLRLLEDMTKTLDLAASVGGPRLPLEAAGIVRECERLFP